MTNILERVEDDKQLMKITQALTDFFENKKNVQFKTDLSSSELRNVIRAEYLNYIVHKEFGVDLFLKKRLTDPLKEHLISRKRKGRTEFFEAVKSLLSFEQKRESGFRKMLGL